MQTVLETYSRGNVVSHELLRKGDFGKGSLLGITALIH